MAPLTHTRLIRSLNLLVEKASTDLPGPAFSSHRVEISHAVDAGITYAQAGLAHEFGASSPGQIKHWVCAKIDEILRDVVPPTTSNPAILRSSMPNKRSTRATAVIDAGIKKRCNIRKRFSYPTHVGVSRSTSTRADLSCSATRLDAGTSNFPIVRSAHPATTFTLFEIECAAILIELANGPVVFTERRSVSSRIPFSAL
jgi:hypothetical protein